MKNTYRVAAGLRHDQAEAARLAAKMGQGKTRKSTWIIPVMTKEQLDNFLITWQVSEFRWINISANE